MLVLLAQKSAFSLADYLSFCVDSALTLCNLMYSALIQCQLNHISLLTQFTLNVFLH
jgi:hypothetical protein